MKVLLTTLELGSYSGLPLYTRDVALELKRQGHAPEIYALNKGRVSQELVAANIPVAESPSHIKTQPDIIHGQHRVSTLISIKQFRRTPGMFICHNHTFWGDQAPFHPRILRYFGVSRVCMERLRKDGVPENMIRFLGNFVDTNRFLPRPPLPSKPRKALVFSNYATDQTHLPAVAEACRRASLDLDVIGMHAKYVPDPENTLGKYDIIFAKGRAAIESMAVGAAVILCDFSGVGPMVTLSEFDKLRLMNFGFQTLTQPLHPENILSQIARYDPEEALLIRNLVRSTASLHKAVKNLVATYHAIIEDYQNQKTRGVKSSLLESAYWERARFWASLTPNQKNRLRPFSEFDPAAKECTYVWSRTTH